jgi:hypothetical protein
MAPGAGDFGASQDNASRFISSEGKTLRTGRSLAPCGDSETFSLWTSNCDPQVSVGFVGPAAGHGLLLQQRGVAHGQGLLQVLRGQGAEEVAGGRDERPPSNCTQESPPPWPRGGAGCGGGASRARLGLRLPCSVAPSLCNHRPAECRRRWLPVGGRRRSKKRAATSKPQATSRTA